jgi:hypothetical protein
MGSRVVVPGAGGTKERGNDWHDDMETGHGDRSSMQDERGTGEGSGQSGVCRTEVYYFCSDTCHKAFTAEPQKYASGKAAADHSCCGGHK